MGGNDSYGTRFDGRMLPAMLHAYSIARATAMMCGSKTVQAEFDRHIKELLAQAGIPNLLHAVDEYKWQRACDALAKAKTYHWYGHKRYSDEQSHMSLIVDDREYQLEHGFGGKTANLAAIQEFLERYAHVEAVKAPYVEHWRAYEPPEVSPSPPPPPECGDEEEEPSGPAP